jgi:predicted SAM-dependent methyltransferase
MPRLHPDFSEPPVIGQLLNELNSLIGRIFFRKRSRFFTETKPFLVDIGEGERFTPGWTHVDFYRPRIRKFWKPAPIRIQDVETDFRYPLECSDDVADGVYSGHTLEHLYPNHAYGLLSEIFRILRPGGWLRINVPDLQWAINCYLGKVHAPPYKYRAEAISHLTQDYGHHSAWDFELLSSALELTGFHKIKRVAFGEEGTDKRLIKERLERKEGTLVVEAQKPSQ